MRWTVLPVVALVALAGCIGTDGPAGPTTNGTEADPTGGTGDGNGTGPTDPTGTSTTDLEAPPTWQVGDHWTYQMSGPDIDREATMVVAEDTGDAWVVRTDDRQTAFFDARFDVSYMGPQSKADLAGSQGDAQVRYFDWPLAEGNSWNTTWDGIERTVTVRSTGDGTADLVARDPEGNVDVEYTYDAAVGWFSEMRFFENGSESFGLTLTGSGSSFSDTYLTVQLRTLIDDTYRNVSGFDESVEVGPSADFWYQASWSASQPGGLGFGYSGYNMSEASGGIVPLVNETCPCEGAVEGVVDVPPGQWGFSGGTGLVPEDGHLDLTVIVRTWSEHGLSGSPEY